jgi:hypothetical protein
MLARVHAPAAKQREIAHTQHQHSSDLAELNEGTTKLNTGYIWVSMPTPSACSRSDLDHRRDDARRGQHRRCRPAARRWDIVVFDEVYAPSTLGILLREFTFGRANQLAALARQHLVGWPTGCRCFIDMRIWRPRETALLVRSSIATSFRHHDGFRMNAIVAQYL